MVPFRAGAVLPLLLLTFIQQGSAQTQCSREVDCTSLFPRDDVMSCCSIPDALTNIPTPGSEICEPCYIFGWVQSVSADRSSAVLQKGNINAVEGDVIPLTVYFTKNGPRFLGLTVNIETGGSADVVTDYELSQSNFFLENIPIPINVTLLNDGVAGERPEIITLTLRPVRDLEDNEILSNSTITIFLQDNDIETGFRVNTLTVSESTDTVDVCLTTLGTPAVDTIINVTVMYGSAEEADFNLVTEEVVITATSTEPCVSFIALADSLGLEGDEMLTLSLSGPENVMIGNATLDITIQDADVVTFEFIDTSSEGTEGSEVINVTITQSVATAAPISLTVTPTEYSPEFGSIPPFDPASPNLATPGDDYSTEVITFTVPPGTGPTTIQLDIVDDTIQENTEQFFGGVLAFSGDSTGAVLGRSNVLLHVVDDDSLVIGFESVIHDVEERDSDFAFNMTLFKTLESEQTYSIGLIGIPDTAGDDDFSVPEEEVFLFPPESETLTVFVIITGDTRIELTEQFFVRILPLPGPPFRFELATVATLVNITDNDGVYVYIPDENPYFVEEGTTTTITFRSNPPPPEDGFGFEFDITLATENGTAFAGSDYIKTSEVFSGAEIISINVTVLEDVLVELPELFFVIGHINPRFVDDIPVSSVDANITIVSAPARIRFEEIVYPTSELAGSVDVCVAVTNGIMDFDLPVNIDVLTMSTAVEGEDYSFDSVPPVINIPSGTSRDCLTINIIASALAEDTEGIYLVINETTTMADVEEGSTIVVIDADGVVTLGFSSDEYQFVEGDAVEVVVEYVGPLDRDITYRVFSAGLVNETVTIDAGTISASITHVIPGFGEDVIALEPDVVFDVELSLVQPDPQVNITVPVTTVTITDNDGPVTIGFDEMDMTVDENAGTINVPVTLAQEIAVPVTVGFMIASGTAMEGPLNDYVVTGVSPLTFTESGTQTISVAIVDDMVFEDTESFSIVLSNPQPGSVMLNPDTITITITDDDALPRIRFEEIVYPTSELDGSVDVCVAVTNGIMDFDLPVNIEVLPMSTAVEGEDYSFDSVPPVINIQSGMSRGCLTINIIASALAEDIEGIYLAINETTTMADVEEGSTIVVINADGVVTLGFSSDEYQFVEGDAIEVVVEYVGPLDRDITYRVFSAGLINETTSIEAGTISASITHVIPGFDEDVIALEPDVVFDVELSLVQPDPQVNITVPVTTVTITDNDGPVTIGFDEMDMTVDEDAGTINVPVTLAQEIAVPVTVGFMIVSGTAMEGPLNDYVRTGLSSLTFTESGTQTIPVAIVDDMVFEDTESFSIVLSNPQPDSVVLNPDTITITIRDNDERTEPPVTVNITVVGDPFYTVPIELAGPLPDAPLIPLTPLCYEFHGEAGRIFNLVNDVCTLVNAHYTQPIPEVDINVIDAVTVRAKDSADVCRDIRMQLNGCSVTVDGAPVNGTYSMNDISVRKYPSRVRISVPNCASSVVMWMLCERGPLPNPMSGNDVQMDLIKFVLARGVNLNPTSHGVLGQMWNIPFAIAEYTGDRGFLDPNDPAFYMTINNTYPDSSTERTFVAVLQDRSWERTRVPCLYAGNRQAGPIGDIPEDEVPNESVIEGEYTDYIVTSEYASDCTYCKMFSQDMCLL